MSIQTISVLGGGAWGTALAQTCARAGRAVALWEHDAGNAEHLAGKRESRFLPGVRLEDSIKVTRDLAEAARAQAILLVVPPPELCTDNGAMIAWAGAERLALGLTDTLDVSPRARWPLGEVTKPAKAAAAPPARGS